MRGFVVCGVWALALTACESEPQGGAPIVSSLGPDWRVETLDPGVEVGAVWGTSAGMVFAVGPQTLLRSTDRGQSWLALSADGLATMDLYDVWTSEQEDVYVVGRARISDAEFAPIILSSHDAGTTWTRATGLSGTAVWAVHGRGDKIYALGDQVWKSTDRGASWQATGIGGSGSYLSTESDESLITVGSGQWYGLISRSTDEGATWTGSCSRDPGFSAKHYGNVFAMPGGPVWVVGWYTPSYTPRDGFIGRAAPSAAPSQNPQAPGTECYEASSEYGPTEPLRGIWASSPLDVWASGGKATYLHNDGAAWKPVGDGPGFDAVDIWGSGANDVYFVGGNHIAHYAPRP